MFCYQKIWQKWTLETLENIFQNEGFRIFSNVQTFPGSTKEGNPGGFSLFANDMSAKVWNHSVETGWNTRARSLIYRGVPSFLDGSASDQTRT